VVSIVTWLQAGWSGDQFLAQTRDFLRTVLIWAIMQQVVFITYWHCGTANWFHLLEFLTLEDGTDRLSQNNGKELALLTVYNPEERSSYLLHGRSLNSHNKFFFFFFFSKTSWPALWPTQPPVQLVQGVLLLGGKIARIWNWSLISPNRQVMIE
jgi:hypothetical protein